MVNERLPQHWSFGAKLATLITSVLSFWFVGALAIVGGLERGLQVRPLILGVTFLILHALFGVAVLLLSPASAPKGSNKVSPLILAIRGSCAMMTIFIGSIIARSEPSAGGFISCFPAIYMTTMISVWVSQGDKVASGATGPMVLGGLSVSIFAVAYGVLIPTFGWQSTAIMAYLIAVIGWSLPLAFFLRWRNSKTPASSSPSTTTVDLPQSSTSESDSFTEKHLIHHHHNHHHATDEDHIEEKGQQLGVGAVQLDLIHTRHDHREPGLETGIRDDEGDTVKLDL